MNVIKDYVNENEVGLALPRGTHTSVAELHIIPSVSVKARTLGVRPGELLLLRGSKVTQTVNSLGSFASESNISLMN